MKSYYDLSVSTDILRIPRHVGIISYLQTLEKLDSRLKIVNKQQHINLVLWVKLTAKAA